jgi:hypothetical protein
VYVPQIALIVVALLAILLWFMGGYQTALAKDERPSLPAVLLVSWLVASAVFGPAFFVIRAAGIFDITIERLIFSAVVFLLVTGLFTGNVRFQVNVAIEIVMVIFITGCILSMIRTGFIPAAEGFLSPWFVFISGYLFPFILFIFAKNYITREKDVTLILHALFYLGIYLSITAFFEYTDLRQFVFPRFINDFEIGIHVDRARGPFLNAPFNGVGILIGLICGLHLLQNKTGFAKVFHQAALLPFFPAVFFTLTRSVYVGLVVALFVILGWYKTSVSKWKLISLPLALVLIVGIVNSPRLLSTERREGGVAQVEEVSIRFALLKRSYFFLTENPLTGVGFAQFAPSTVRSYKLPISSIETGGLDTIQHSHLMGIAAEMGIPGVLAYLTLIILTLRRLKQLAGKLPETGIMGNNLRVVIVAIWCVYLNNNLFVEPTTSLFVNAVPFIFAGLADGLYTRSLESGLLAQSRIRMSQSPMRIINSHV